MFIFYTVNVLGGYGIGMLEVLFNPKLTDSEQLVIDKGQLQVPASNSDNFGQINIGGGLNYLLTFFDKFTEIKGYTICGYKEKVASVGSTSCVDLTDEQFTLSPFTSNVINCDSYVSNEAER